MKQLYAKDNIGNMRTWMIEELTNGIVMYHGLIDGSLQEKFEEINEGLASRSLEEQIHSRALSRINKKIDSGYCESFEEAQNKPRTNSLGFEKPMLAAKFNTVKNIDLNNTYYQFKYDGNRMPVTNQNGINVPYSRQGKLIETIPEISEGIIMPENETIDGEIYCHGQSLQTIVSWVKRRQADTLRLRYHVYDIMMDAPYEERLACLMQMELGAYAELVPTYKFDPKTQTIRGLLLDAISKGYEGLILRQNDFSYEVGKRSKSLIKVKQFLDEEFQIIGMHLSKDGLPMIDFDTGRGTVGKATAPGTMIQKQAHYENRGNLYNKFLHLEFSQWTKDDKPFHPTATKILDTKTQLK